MRIPALSSQLFAIAVSLVLGAAPAAADLLIVVDKSAQRMSVSIDGTPRYAWRVSTGRQGYDTPSGSFRPFRLERDHFSKEWDDAPMPHSIFFTDVGHAIHGSYDVRHLGSPVSHGWIRIRSENATLLFSLVEAEGLERTKVVARRRSLPAESSILYDVIGDVVRTSDRTGVDACVQTHRAFDNQGRVEHESIRSTTSPAAPTRRSPTASVTRTASRSRRPAERRVLDPRESSPS